MMIVDLVEHRFPLSWTSLKDVNYLLYYDEVDYDEVVLKAGQ